jgi:beta-xylosidase
VRFARGNFLWVAEFDLAAGRIKPATLKQCFGRTDSWEATSSYVSVPIMEGPTVIKLKGRYYLFYSANHYRSVDYAVGYAIADTPVGPWLKHARNPILHRSIVGENGSGHGDVFRGPEGGLYYVYHVHHSDTTVTPRRTRIVPLVLSWNGGEARYDITVDATRLIKPVAPAREGNQ